MSLVLGIDLGTTYSCVSYIDEYGKASVLKNSDGDHTTPSVVLLESKDNIVVGAEAKRSLEIDAEKTIQFIKRKMGREDDTVSVNGITYHAPEISSMILKKLVKDANDELHQIGVLPAGETVKDVVITCPAYFGMNERQATKTAGELAGLNVLSIINEPTAAAISYGVSGTDKDETVLVYDLGGGTFDITVMNIKGNNISVVCTGGDDYLGGKDWDEALLNYVVERYQSETGEDLMEDPETLSALYVDVETWKKALTPREKVNISVNGLGGRFREELTRDKYEELTQHLLDRTKNLMDDILNTSANQGYPLSKIDKVLLVGGSSRMPQVAAMIERDYNKVPVLADPDEAVAKGAAIYAGNQKAYEDFVLDEAKKQGKSIDDLEKENLKTGDLDRKFALLQGEDGAGSSKISISNVLSCTYGIKSLKGSIKKDVIISNILIMNQSLPAKNTKTYSTVSNGQTGIDVDVFETRSTDDDIPFEDQEPIAKFFMEFKQPVPKGTEIETTMSIDNTGLMKIYAVEKLHNSILDVEFQLSNQMNEKELQEAQERMRAISVE